MFTLPITLYIANAAARFSGRHGAVTRQAQNQGCSRQTVYDHASVTLRGQTEFCSP